MKVILLQELKGKGGEGDIVEVTRGHAVNYLFPKKLAVEATDGNLKQLELRKHNIAKREAERLDSAEKIFDALNGATITIRARVGEAGRLFGSVSSLQIAAALQERFGVAIDRRKIDLNFAIKTAGEHTVTVSVYRDLKATIVVKVIDERTPVEVAKPVADKAAEPADDVADKAAELADDVADKAAELADEKPAE